jgi:hypothetical protein
MALIFPKQNGSNSYCHFFPLCKASVQSSGNLTTKFPHVWIIPLLIFCQQAYAQEIQHSKQSGNWTNRNTWECSCVPAASDHAIIKEGHTVTFVSTNRITDLTIEAGAILSDNGLANTISGNLHIDGVYSGSGSITLQGDDKTISGTGIISNTNTINIFGNKTILPGTQLIKNAGNILLQGNAIVYNYGNITAGADINGCGSCTAAKWINETGSTLNIAGRLMATGILEAAAAGNTVNYFGSSNSGSVPCAANNPCQNIRRPLNGEYYHLSISGVNSTVKRLITGNFTIKGDLTINSSFDAQNRDINILGNWNNTGAEYTPGTGTVTFSGTASQQILSTSGETFYSLTINKTAGSLSANNNVTVSNQLTMTSGNIDVGSNTLTIGTSATDVGGLNWTQGSVIGKLQRWINSNAAPVYFPVGTAAFHRAAQIKFNNNFNAGSLIVEFNSNYPGNIELPVNDAGSIVYNIFRDGYWIITNANSLSANNFNLELTGDGFTGFTIGPTTRILSRTSSTANWATEGTHVDAVENTARRNGVELLPGHFAFGDLTNCLGPLTSSISGATDVCQGNSAAYAVTQNGNNTYQWQVDGGTITSGQGTHDVTINWDNSGKVGSVAVVETNACTSGPLIPLPVNIHAIPPAEITGKRNVPENGDQAETYAVSQMDGYTYTWEIEGNGILLNGQHSNSISVDWNNKGDAFVKVFATHHTCTTNIAQTVLPVNIYNVISSRRTTGNWGVINTWTCDCVPGINDNVAILAGHTVSQNVNNNGNGVSVKNLIINSGGTLNVATNKIKVLGDLQLNGTISGAGIIDLSSAAEGVNLDGIGTITNTIVDFSSNREILPGTIINKTGIGSNSFNLLGSVTVTNRGSVTLAGGLYGSSNSTWINAVNASLSVGGATLASGKLIASALGNTVRYAEGQSNNIKDPEHNQYHNLFIAGTGTKTAPAVLNISGNLVNDGNFNSNNGIVNFNGTSVMSGSAITQFNHIHILPDAELTSTENIFAVSGHFNNQGNFTPNQGTVIINGTTTSILSGNVQKMDFFNLQLANNKVLDIELPAIDLYGRLTLGESVNFNAQGKNNHTIFTLRSVFDKPVQDASIGAIPESSSISGQVTVERFMGAIGRANRYISAPVEGVNLAQLTDDFNVRRGSIVWYDESLPGGSNNGYRNWNQNTVLQTGRGYLASMYEANEDVIWDSRGVIHSGKIDLPVTYTVTSGGTDNDGWNLVGNPYPSSIVWKNDPVAWEFEHISPTIYVTDMSNGGRFHVYNFADNSGDEAGSIIALGQAFWVKANALEPHLKIHEAAKQSSTTAHNFYRRDNFTSKQLIIELKSADGHMDKAYLKINPEKQGDFDQRFDAYKLKQDQLNVFFSDAVGRSLVMYTFDHLDDDFQIPLVVESGQDDNYTLLFPNATGFETSQPIYLIDAYTSQAVNIREQASYSFRYFANSHSLSNRFYLSSRPELKQELTLQVQVFPNPVKDNLHVRSLNDEGLMSLALFDLQGKLLWKESFYIETQVDMLTFPVGMYLLKLNGSKGVVISKILKSK